MALHDASTIAAVIVEPMAGSTGVLFPPKGYLQRLREITKKHGILLIFDEVITGYGRLGGSFAANVFGVEPDMITFAKGVTSGTVPMGGVICSAEIHDAFMTGPQGAVELFHGYTYSAHPLACAAGIATLQLVQGRSLVRACGEDGTDAGEGSARTQRDANTSSTCAPSVWWRRSSSNRRPGAVGARAFEAFLKAYEKGVIVRSAADNIVISPAFVIEGVADRSDCFSAAGCVDGAGLIRITRTGRVAVRESWQVINSGVPIKGRERLFLSGVCLVFGLAFGAVVVFSVVGLATEVSGWFGGRSWQPAMAEIVDTEPAPDREKRRRTVYASANLPLQREWRWATTAAASAGTIRSGSRSASWHEEMHEELSASKSADKRLMIWYDPANPSMSVVDRDLRWGVLIFLLPLGLFFSAVSFAAFWLLKNLWRSG